MVQGYNQKELINFNAEKGTQWKFITPAAAHQNGCAESLVKTCKKAIKKAIGDQILTPFQLYTVLLEVANLVNERPIGRIPNDSDDGSYVCPNDVLLGRVLQPQYHNSQGPFKSTKKTARRVEFSQKIVDASWKKWSRDVFQHLVLRKRWKTERRNVQVDDVIVFAGNNAVRGKWSIGRVTNVFPGPDGRVRNVEVKISAGSYRHRLQRLQ